MPEHKSATINVGRIFSQDFFFYIPEYQRPFSWDTENFDDLIDDIISAPRDKEYFLGTLVLHKKNGNDFDVVDGQQRLTSLLILIACLRDCSQTDQVKDELQQKILQRQSLVDGIPERLRLLVRNRNVFDSIVREPHGTLNVQQFAAQPEPDIRYKQAVDCFRRRLTTLTHEEIDNVVVFLNQKCFFIYVSTDTFEDAFRLFTVINDRGKQLRRIDVLKASNLSPDSIINDELRRSYARDWEQAENSVGEDSFENVFHLVRLIILKDKPQGDLLTEYDRRIFGGDHVAKGRDFLDLIFRYVEIYRQVFVDRDILIDEQQRFRALIHIMDKEFRASEWRACLLYFCKKFGASDLYQFTLRLEKVYVHQWVNGIRKDERYSDYRKILRAIDRSNRSGDVIDTMDLDFSSSVDAIQTAAKSKDIYNAGYCRYFLLRLELVASEYDNIKEYTAKTVEHVLPQNPSSDGQWAEWHDLQEISEYVNSLGNLVLLSKSKNSKAQNYDLRRKQTAYLQDRVSQYPRSVLVLRYNEWTKDTILQRTNEAAELLIQDP